MPRVSGEEAVARVRGLVILVRHIVNGDNVPDPTALMLKSDPDALQALLGEREALLEVAKHADQLLNSTTAKHQAEAVHRLEVALAALPGASE